MLLIKKVTQPRMECYFKPNVKGAILEVSPWQQLTDVNNMLIVTVVRKGD